MGNQVKYHPEMAAVMQKVREGMAAYGAFSSSTPKTQAELLCRFARPLAERHPRDVTWEEICGIGWERKNAAAAALVFALALLDEGMFEPPLARALSSWRPYIERALEQERNKRFLLPLYLCGNCVEWLVADPCTAEFVTIMFSKKLRDNLADMGEYILDPDMVLLLRDIADVYYEGGWNSGVPARTLDDFRNLFAHFASKRPRDISWTEECGTYSSGHGLRHQLLTLFTALLDRGLYTQDHKEALERLNEPFKTLLAKNKANKVKHLLCGEDVEFLCALPSNIINRDNSHKLTFAMLKTDNAYLRDLLADFLQTDACSFRPSNEKLDVLLLSMGEASSSISRLEDFTASLFWSQVRYIREKFVGETCQLEKHICFLRGFYQYLAGLDPERDLFENATNLSTELVYNALLSHYIACDYLVTSFYPGIDLGDAERVILILRGYDDLSTHIVSEDSVRLDVSSLKCPFYRQEVLAFVCRSSQTVVGTAKKQAAHICQVLQELFEAKGREGYPNPCLETISRAETSLVRRSIDRLELAAPTKATILSSINVFFQWERDARKRISFEEFALDNLCGLSRGRRQSDAKAIPKEHLTKLSALLAGKGQERLEWKLASAVFHLLLQTEFRIGQICHLDVGCIRPTSKPNEHVICSTSKTSKGEKEECVITQRTLDVLNGAMDATEDVRLRFAKRSLSKYIFIYQDEHGQLRRMSTDKFSEMLAGCCAELGIDPPYTANNLRDTHNTLAVRFSTDEDGEIRPSAALLSGHAGIATTVEHYVDVDIEEMIAATFDVYIGDNLQVDADGKVVEAIPEEARGEDRVVEGGCGCCTAQYCSVSSPLPCLVCESFVTTIDHEPFFVRMIEAVDVQLQHANSRHDAEDLTTIKRLLAAFLAAIYRKKKEIEQERETHG